MMESEAREYEALVENGLVQLRPSRLEPQQMLLEDCTKLIFLSI
jgi:hypothetical protein